MTRKWKQVNLPNKNDILIKNDWNSNQVIVILMTHAFNHLEK